VFVNRCTHAGCKVDVSGQKLVCPCHGSTFGFDGQLAADNSGPARQPLHEGKARVENGQIIVEQA
jgi:Rieske Fe-S protein